VVVRCVCNRGPMCGPFLPFAAAQNSIRISIQLNTGRERAFAAPAHILPQIGESGHSRPRKPNQPCCTNHQGQLCADSALCKAARTVLNCRRCTQRFSLVYNSLFGCRNAIFNKLTLGAGSEWDEFLGNIALPKGASRLSST
jgi:hypothetical protein